MLLTLVGVVSCENDEPQVRHLQLATETIEASGDSEVLAIGYQILSPIEGQSITAECKADWVSSLVVAPGKIEFAVERNTSEEPRTTTIDVVYGNERHAVSVIQAKYDAPISITLQNVDATTVTFDVKTSTEEMTWVGQVVSKEWFEAYTQEEIFAEDMKYYRAMADEEGVSIWDYLLSVLSKGSHSGLRIKGLDTESEYVLYVYGMDQYGGATTEICSASFTTTEPYQGNDVTFDIDVRCEGAEAYVTIVPSHEGVPYFENLISRENYEEFGGTIEAAAQGLIDKVIEDYLAWDYTLADVYSYNTYYTTQNYIFETYSGEEYLVMAFKWNEQCERLSEVSYKWFTADVITASDNVITMQVDNVTQTTFDIKTTTTNDDPYIIFVEPTENIAAMQSDDEIFAYLLDTYGTWGLESYLCEGDIEGTFSYIDHSTDYTVLVFGYEGRVLTTSMLKQQIRTLEPEPDGGSFEIVVSNIDDREANLSIKASDTSVWYYWNVYEASTTDEEVRASIEEVVRVGYNGYYEEFSYYEILQGSTSGTLHNLRPSTDYKIAIVPMDPYELAFTGEIRYGGEFRTLEAVVADIDISVVFDAYYDGDAAADLEPDYFDSFRGYALLPLEVNIVGEYSYYLYTVYNYTEGLDDKEVYDDSFIIENLYASGIQWSPANFRAPWDVEVMIAAVAFDYNDNASEVYRYRFTCTKDGASPDVEEFVQSYVYGPSSAGTLSASRVYGQRPASMVGEQPKASRQSVKRPSKMHFAR